MQLRLVRWQYHGHHQTFVKLHVSQYQYIIGFCNADCACSLPTASVRSETSLSETRYAAASSISELVFLILQMHDLLSNVYSVFFMIFKKHLSNIKVFLLDTGSGVLNAG